MPTRKEQTVNPFRDRIPRSAAGGQDRAEAGEVSAEAQGCCSLQPRTLACPVLVPGLGWSAPKPLYTSPGLPPNGHPGSHAAWELRRGLKEAKTL